MRRNESPHYGDAKERIGKAFRALRKLGYVARQNYLCCGSCAAYQIGLDLEKKGVGEADRKAVYFCRQSEATLKETGGVWINWSGNGHEIAGVLVAHGLHVEWNGTKAQSIYAASAKTKVDAKVARALDRVLDTEEPIRKVLKLNDAERLLYAMEGARRVLERIREREAWEAKREKEAAERKKAKEAAA